jgi:hypothetical protein
LSNSSIVIVTKDFANNHLQKKSNLVMLENKNKKKCIIHHEEMRYQCTTVLLGYHRPYIHRGGMQLSRSLSYLERSMVGFSPRALDRSPIGHLPSPFVVLLGCRKTWDFRIAFCCPPKAVLLHAWPSYLLPSLLELQACLLSSPGHHIL